MRLLLACLLLGLVPLVAPARAQEAPLQEITFVEALRLAEERNTRLRLARNTAEAQENAVALARSASLPDLALAVQPVRRYGLVFDQTTGSLQQETSDAMSASATTSIALYTGGRDAAEVRRRRLEREAGELALERTRDDVLFTVASQFLQTVLDGELVRIRREALAAQQAQLERLEALVEEGVRPRADVLQQAALVAEAEFAVLQAESQLQLSETALVQTLQLDPLGRYRFVAPDLGEAATPAPFDLEALIGAALDRRADLRAQDLQIRAAEAGVRAARAGYLPRLTLFGSFGSSYSSFARRAVPGTSVTLPLTTADGQPVLVGGEPFTISAPGRFEPVPFGRQLVDNRSGSIGLALQVPVFDRFVTRAQVRQAQLAVENERIRREDLRQEIALQVRQAYLDYRNAVQRLAVAERQLEAAAAALEAEQERFELGVATLAELTLARARAVEAESARAQAAAQLLFQQTRLEYAAGLSPAEAPARLP